MDNTTLEAVLKRDRTILLFALAGLSLLAWAYMFYLARGMETMSMEMTLPQLQAWGPLDLILLFFMWTVMMVAMMVPSAAPMISMFATIYRRRHHQQRPYVSVSIFLLGYLVVWTGFSLLATLIQWGLHSAAFLSPKMVSTNPILGGVLLLAAGVFQWSSLKDTCLTQCQSVMGFLTREWREGARGAFIMGIRHGGYCLGCCWLLMGLLFVAGVMNLLWIAAIAVFVLLEKVVPPGVWISWITGGILFGSGLWMLANGTM